MRMLVWLAVLWISTAAIEAAHGQFGTDPAAANKGKVSTRRWKVGMVVEAVGGPCKGLRGTVPVPINWPEQTVRLVREEITPNVKGVTYRVIDGSVKQMLVNIPQLRSGETATALVTFEIDRREIHAPDDPDQFQKPRRVSRELKRYLGPSPSIESKHRDIRELAHELTDPSLPAWRQVEVFYDYVRDNVTYQNGPLKGALSAFRNGYGDCEELTSLFIALCRASDIPARTVWIPDHCYPEFYLEDAEGQGHWLPCQAAGTRAFGSMAETRPVLQKGDNFRVPGKKDRQRYVAEWLTGKAVAGGGKPRVQFVREIIPLD